MKTDVAILGVVRNGERAPVDWQMRAVILAQVTAFAAFTAEAAWLPAWWAMLIVIFGAAQIAGLQTLFRRLKAHKAAALAVSPGDTGGFYFETGPVGCDACVRAEQHRLHDLEEVPRG